ncbi:hypothetical protein E3V33_05290 [Candidatus Marinimicrobia bacterium MT.SAG.4]|nr:hypothetical protein E3V33_05290 [Candidatus Marinimicrobia bacterium MT.SAG.4]
MTYNKYISWSILSVILVIAINRETTSAQLKADKIINTAAFFGNIFNNLNLNNPQLVELNRTLYSLSNEVKRVRIRNSNIFIGLGAAFTIGGLTLLNASNKDDAEGFGEEFAASIATTFLVFGAASVATGVYVRLSPSDIEEYYIVFRDIPETTPEESEKKLKAGELSFEKFAQSARRKRKIWSGIYAALYLSAAAQTGKTSDGVFWIGVGAWKYFSKSRIEKAYDRYIAMKEIYSYTEGDKNLSWKMFPLPGKGIGGVVSLDF